MDRDTAEWLLDDISIRKPDIWVRGEKYNFSVHWNRHPMDLYAFSIWEPVFTTTVSNMLAFAVAEGPGLRALATRGQDVEFAHRLEHETVSRVGIPCEGLGKRVAFDPVEDGLIVMPPRSRMN